MPNHVRNVLILTFPEAAQAEAFAAAHCVENAGLDFKSVIERPALYDKSESGSASDAVTATLLYALTGTKPVEGVVRSVTGKPEATPDDALEHLAENPEKTSTALINLHLLRKYGYANWYDWSIANWGTKWGAYSGDFIVQDATVEIRFDTAWSPPEPILSKLAELYPQAEIRHSCWDEGWGFATDTTIPAGETVFEINYVDADTSNAELYEHIYCEAIDPSYYED